MKTKIVAVWHVEFSVEGEPRLTWRPSHEEAAAYAKALVRATDGGATCIAITGPHQHRVSA